MSKEENPIIFDEVEVTRMNLKVLRKHDPSILKVLFTAGFVSLYFYEEEQDNWVSPLSAFNIEKQKI